MSEFCVKCWNKLNGTHERKSAFILSEELDICEGCGKWKHVIVCYKEPIDIIKTEKTTKSIKYILSKIRNKNN